MSAKTPREKPLVLHEMGPIETNLTPDEVKDEIGGLVDVMKEGSAERPRVLPLPLSEGLVARLQYLNDATFSSSEHPTQP